MEDPSLIEQLTPWIASGAVAVVALLIGRRIERRDTKQAWLRDQRLQAFSRMLDNSHAVFKAAATLWEDQSVEAKRELHSLCFQSGRITSELQLLGPPDVFDAAERLAATHYAATERVLSDDWLAAPFVALLNAEEGAALSRAEATFAEAAQAAL